VISTRAVAKVLLVAVGVLCALYLLYLVRQVLAAVFIAVFIAVALGPAVDLVQRRRLPRALAILLVYIGLFLAIFGVGLLVVPPIVEGVNQFASDVPGYVDDIRTSETLRQYDDQYGITDQLQQQAQSLPGRLGDAAGALQAVTVGVFSAVFQLVTVLVMAFFFLLQGGRMAEFCFRQLRPEHERRARDVGAKVYKAVGGYVTGALTIAIIAGTSTYIVLSILGIGFAVPLAVLMGFLVLIPLVGATIGGVIIAIVTAFEDFPTALIVWTAFFVLYQQVENNVLQPFIYRRTVALHPLVVIIAVLMGASLLGVLGALLAIPVAATSQIIVKEAWALRRPPGAEAGGDQLELSGGRDAGPAAAAASGEQPPRHSPDAQ